MPFSEQHEIISFLRLTTEEWSKKLLSNIRLSCDFSYEIIGFDSKNAEQIRRFYTYIYININGRTKLSKSSIFPYLLQLEEIQKYVEHILLNIDLNVEKHMIEPGFFDIVFEAGWPGLIFHEACGHCLESDNIVRGTSIFGKKDLGRKVSIPELTLVDDPTKRYGGYLDIDDEGNKSMPIELIKNGYLASFITDEKGANTLSTENNGHGRKEKYSSKTLPRMTNTFIFPNGICTREDIISNIDNGIYVKNLGGGSVNISTGEFCFYVTEAEKIEGGKVIHHLNDLMVIDNSLHFLENIFSIANNLVIESGFCKKEGQCVPVGCGQPTIAVHNVYIR